MPVTQSKQHDKRLDGASLTKRHKSRINESGGAWSRHFDDVRDYVQPYRVRLNKGDMPGRKRTTKIFDSTAVVAAFRGAQKLRDLLTPDGRQWAMIAPGPLVTNADEKQRMKRLLDDVSKLAWQVIDLGDFSAAAPEFFQDLYSGTGHMLVLKGGGVDKLIDWIPLPTEAVEVEENAAGDIVRWMYLEEIEIGKLRERWPGLKLDAKWKRLEKEKPTQKVELTLACTRQARVDPTRPPAFDLQVCRYEDGLEIWHEELRTSCFITGRLFKVPGETRGRGFPMLAMPHIKTLNKAVELQLKAAAYAVLGAWMTSDDGVYNPRAAVVHPGGMLKVKSTGGRRGPSIADLGLPKQFDVAALVSQDMRFQIKEMMLDDKLPDEQGAVRSPTEIIARLRQLTADVAGHFGRLKREIIVPIMMRVLDILDQWDLLPTMIRIDNLLIQVQVLSALADTQALEEADRATRWLAVALDILGPEQIDLVADRVQAAAYLHDVMNAPMEVKLSPEKIAENVATAQAVGEQIVATQANGTPADAQNGR
jgi:hypothetical protein